MTYDKYRNLRASAFVSLHSSISANSSKGSMNPSDSLSGFRRLQDVSNITMTEQAVMPNNASDSYNSTQLVNNSSISFTTTHAALSDASVILSPVLASQIESLSVISQLLSLSDDELNALRDTGVDVDAIIAVDNYINGNESSDDNGLPTTNTFPGVELSTTFAPNNTSVIKTVSSKPTKKPTGILNGAVIGLEGDVVTTDSFIPGIDTTIFPTRDIFVVGSSDESIFKSTSNTSTDVPIISGLIGSSNDSSLVSNLVPTRDTFASELATDGTGSYPPVVLPGVSTIMSSTSGGGTTSKPNLPSFTIFTTTDVSTLNLPIASTYALRRRNGVTGQIAGIGMLLILMIF